MKHNHYSMHHKEKIIKQCITVVYHPVHEVHVLKTWKTICVRPLFDTYMCLILPNTFLGSKQLFFFIFVFFYPNVMELSNPL